MDLEGKQRNAAGSPGAALPGIGKSDIGPFMNVVTTMRLLVFCLVLAGWAAAGCVSEPKRTYSDAFVKNFVDLTMLYERSKMEQKMTDSTYKVSVEKFFRERGVDQTDFKKQVEVLSTDAEVWKLFIGDVTKRIDSLKQAEYNNNAG